MILYMSPCLRDCDCILEHPLRAAAPMELLVDEADADLGDRLLGRPALPPECSQQQVSGEGCWHTQNKFGDKRAAGSRHQKQEPAVN